MVPDNIVRDCPHRVIMRPALMPLMSFDTQGTTTLTTFAHPLFGVAHEFLNPVKSDDPFAALVGRLADNRLDPAGLSDGEI